MTPELVAAMFDELQRIADRYKTLKQEIAAVKAEMSNTQERIRLLRELISLDEPS